MKLKLPDLQVCWQKHLKHYLVYTLLILLFTYIQSCTSSSSTTVTSNLYKNNYPLTSDIAYSTLSHMEVKIPQGWFTAEDTICKCIDIWLIRDDFSASLNLTMMTIDTTISGEEGIKYLMELSKTQKRQKLSNFTSLARDEYFSINDKHFAAYEYRGDEGYPVRVVIFEYENKYWEFSALPSSTIGRGKIVPEELFLIQNSVLASIK